jgi:hypothetical protein
MALELHHAAVTPTPADEDISTRSNGLIPTLDGTSGAA